MKKVSVFFVLALCLNVFAQDVDYRNLINVSIGLGWLIDMDKFDTNGKIDTYLPLYIFPEDILEDGVLYLDIDQNVPFKNITGTTRFIVPEIDYGLEAGLIRRLRKNLLGSIFYRRQGVAQLDKLGDIHLDLIGASVLTEDYLVRNIYPGLKWRLSASGSVDKKDMDGGALLEAGFIYNLCRMGSVGFGIEGDIDTFVNSGGIEADVEVGPKLSFYGRYGSINSIVAKYITDHTPLGLEDEGFYLGVMVEAGSHFEEGEVEPKPIFMDYGGTLNFGYANADRIFADIDLLGNIPEVEEGYEGIYFAYEARSFYLTGSNDNLYYVTVAGIEKEWNDYTIGFYFNHRSGHLVDSSNDFEKDDLNLYEVGIYSPGWHIYRSKKSALTFGRIGDVGRINFFLRLGMNADDTFVSRGHIDTKIGLRFDLEKTIFSLTPYISNYDEIIGDAVLHDTTLGLMRQDGWFYNLKYHYDDQISATENGALILSIGKVF